MGVKICAICDKPIEGDDFAYDGLTPVHSSCLIQRLEGGVEEEPIPEIGLREVETEEIVEDYDSEDEIEDSDESSSDYEEVSEEIEDSEDKNMEDDLETTEESSETIEENTESEEETIESEPEKDESVKEAVSGEVSETVDSEIRFRKKKLKDKVANDPDSFTERWRRARLLRQGYVILKTLDRDPKTGYFTLDIDLVKKEDLPIKAVQCTGEKNTYGLDKVKGSMWYAQTRQDIYDRTKDKRNLFFTARDAALYMMSNKLDNALMEKWSDFNHVNLKKFFIPAAIGVGVLVLILVMRL